MKEVEEAISLLQKLIATPSFSDEEGKVADIWETWLKNHGVKEVNRFHNNVYALSEYFHEGNPILMLNSHMDTVKPSGSYTRNPFSPDIEDGILYGLGSNDAGASGVALAMTFLDFYKKRDLPFNLLLAITASEEKMGEYGMRAFLPYLRSQGLYPEMAIVGEPTGCEAAVAERGLVVCDAEVKGVAGHAARQSEGNAIYRAIDDIDRLRNIDWPLTSEILGPIKVTVTMIEAGTQHNVIPDLCKYVVDIRTTDVLSNEETVSFLQSIAKWSVFTPRSTRIRASALSKAHPLVIAAEKCDIPLFISPTTSDMAVMYDISSIKIGPGMSERSHKADEFIKIEEIEKGISTYKRYLKTLATIINC